MKFVKRRIPKNSRRWSAGIEFVPTPESPKEATPEIRHRAELLDAILLDGKTGILDAILIVNRILETESQLNAI